MTYTVTLLKRGNDQKQGTVVSLKLFHCRKSMVNRTGEPLQGQMTSSHRTVWHIPGTSLKQIGVAFISAADRIVDGAEVWQPESDTEITEKMFNNEIDLSCLRCDPPKVSG